MQPFSQTVIKLCFHTSLCITKFLFSLNKIKKNWKTSSLLKLNTNLLLGAIVP